MNVEALFLDLYRAPVERMVDNVLAHYNLKDHSSAWQPYGGTKGNYGVVENQQSSSIPALIEKITNGIDAILIRACLEQGIDPHSEDAPRSISEALCQFFPDHNNWDLRPTTSTNC